MIPIQELTHLINFWRGPLEEAGVGRCVGCQFSLHREEGANDVLCCGHPIVIEMLRVGAIDSIEDFNLHNCPVTGDDLPLRTSGRVTADMLQSFAEFDGVVAAHWQRELLSCDFYRESDDDQSEPNVTPR